MLTASVVLNVVLLTRSLTIWEEKRSDENTKNDTTFDPNEEGENTTVGGKDAESKPLPPTDNISDDINNSNKSHVPVSSSQPSSSTSSSLFASEFSLTTPPRRAWELAMKCDKAQRIFTKLWRFKHNSSNNNNMASRSLSDADGLPDSIYLTVAFCAVDYFDSSLERMREIQRCFVAYLVSAEALCQRRQPNIDDSSDTNFIVTRFLFSAFQHGVFIGTKGLVDIYAEHLYKFLSQQQSQDRYFVQWLHFFFWMRLGAELSHEVCPALEGVERNPGVFPQISKTLSLEELEQTIMYEEVSDKGATPSCLFISHRWATPEHPDPDGTERRRMAEKLRRTQTFLDYFINPETIPNLQLASSVWTEDERRSPKEIFSCELEWVIFFFLRLQPRVLVWYDYMSIPQGSDDISRSVRRECLADIRPLCQFNPMCAIASDDYSQRGWCVFEYLVSGLRNPSKTLVIRDDLTFWNCANVLAAKMENIHGRFCQKLEFGSEEPSDVFTALDIVCTNGSDIRFLSESMAQYSRFTNRFGCRKMVHAFFTACHLYTTTFIVNGTRPDSDYYHVVSFMEHLKVRTLMNSQTTNKYAIAPAPLRMNLTSDYIGKGMQFIVESYQDWNIEGFNDDVYAFMEMLLILENESVDCPRLGDPWAHSNVFADTAHNLYLKMGSTPMYVCEVNTTIETRTIDSGLRIVDRL